MSLEIKGNPKSYRLIQTLHESQWSQVLRVVLRDPDLEINEIVVLKIIQSKNSFQDCIQELESLKRVRVKQCVEVLNWEKFDNRPAIVLENIKGITLKELIRDVALDSNLRNYILDEIHQGIKELSRVGIYHGDLSPNNVMLNTDGFIKLIDYGMSNISGKYTPNFVSPETLSRSEYGYQSDLYSLGKLSFYLGATEKEYMPLLATQPKERVFSKVYFDKQKCQDKLAYLVNRQYIDKTVRNTLIKDKTINSKKPMLQLFLSLLASLVFVSSSANSNREIFYQDSSFLTVVTKDWIHIQEDNVDYGYGPLYQVALKSGVHRLKWKMAQKSGELILKLKPFEHKKLTSKDFN